MLNTKGRCRETRPAITKETCKEMRDRKARICVGCSGPIGIADLPVEQIAVDSNCGSAPASPILPIRMEASHLLPGSVDSSSAAAPTPQPLIPGPHGGGLPGFFVDFTGCEDLLETWTEAAAERDMDPASAALDIIYLFAEGLLCLRRPL